MILWFFGLVVFECVRVDVEVVYLFSASCDLEDIYCIIVKVAEIF